MDINLKEKLRNLPPKPGVYLFKDGNGEILYVGKAKNLRNRVRSYFLKSNNHLPRTSIMIGQIADLDFVVVSSEVESLILENNFIKQNKPRFNVRLRDDKNYLFIKIDYDYEIPQIYTVRHSGHSDTIRRFGLYNKYFGPYTSALSVKQTLKFVRGVFRICGNKKVGTKPCFHYELGRCPGVCVGKISIEEYSKSLSAVEQFLNHRRGEVAKVLKSRMIAASKKRQYEKAAKLRDDLKSLEHIWEKQKIVFTKKLSQDYFSIFLAGNRGAVNLFMVRDGKLIDRENFELLQTKDRPVAEILQSFLKQYYADASDIPKEVMIPCEIPEQAAIEAWRGTKISIPQKGRKLQLLKLGEENARIFYEREIAGSEKRLDDVLVNLKEALNLPAIPRRIEGFDVSNIQGTNPVGSMVVFENGRPAKAEYRKFKINVKETPDDVAMMREMLQRRAVRLLDSQSPKPDLMIVDGGKAQLNAALSVFSPHGGSPEGRHIPIIGLAKRLEEIFLPGRKDPIRLRADSSTLFLLQQIRDEAHRFAVTFHIKRRGQAGLKSQLDSIPGVGPSTKKKLLKKFGTVSAIRQMPLDKLSAEVGMARAKKIKEQL
ncbi:MAG: excinuclease ABC subunit UvrC [bacterium]|nr:excinuclease ABC subunit UvrC [bacterium]